MSCVDVVDVVVLVLVVLGTGHDPDALTYAEPVPVLPFDQLAFTVSVAEVPVYVAVRVNGSSSACEPEGA